MTDTTEGTLFEYVLSNLHYYTIKVYVWNNESHPLIHYTIYEQFKLLTKVHAQTLLS